MIDMENVTKADNVDNGHTIKFEKYSKLSIKRLLLVALFFLVIMLLASTIILALLYNSERHRTNVSADTQSAINDTCTTQYCIKAANYLLESIDQTVDPCENFYQFSCGNWLKTARIPDDATSQDIGRILNTDLTNTIIDLLSTTPSNTTKELDAVTNSRRLYNSCMDEVQIESDGVVQILSIIKNEFGGWPIFEGSNWNSSAYSFSQLFLKLKQYNTDFIYSITTDINEKNSSIFGIRIGQGSLGLFDKNYYMIESAITVAYRNYIRDIASELNNGTAINDTDVLAIFNFEKEIAKYHWTANDKKRRHSETVYTTFGNLTTQINTTFDFSTYFRELFDLFNITLKDADLVTIAELEFIRNMSLLIDRESPQTIQNYLIWRFVMNEVRYMPKRFRAIRLTFNQYLLGITTESTRAKTCATYVNDKMGFVVSKLYVKEYFDATARNEAIEMINYIRKVLINMINESTWMDPISKAKAIEKAMVIGENVGYPDNLNNDTITTLEKDYAEYNFNASFINNVLLESKLQVKANLRLLRESVDRKSWFSIAPTIVNAFYHPSLNDIFLPAAILQSPYFHKDAPKYLNYGAIGMIVGHELTHGFDDLGRQYDKDGNKIPWWTNTTSTEFNRRKTCIIDQYSNYTLAQANLPVIGQQTQGENIADNGGLKEAFFAYQKWSEENANVDKKLPGLSQYTEEQLYFISYAHSWCTKMTDQLEKLLILLDVHSPAEFRVIGPTSNFVEFDRVFGCKPGQGNSRTKKCSVW